MTNQHPITPPDELVDKWVNQSPYINPEGYIATQAAQWGADQELEACVEWLGDAPVVWNNNKAMHPGSFLRAIRRPNPPTLKEQALSELNLTADPDGAELSRTQVELIRRALESL